MKNEIINEIISGMMSEQIDTEVINRLRSRIILAFDGYDVVKTKNEVIKYEETEDEKMFKKFIITKKVNGCSSKTIKYYTQTIRKAMISIGKQYKDITVDDIRYLLAVREIEEGISRRTCDNIRRVLSTFFSFMYKEGYIKENPLNKLGDYKYEIKVKHAFSKYEIELMRNSLKTFKEKAVFEILLSTGCRVSELIGIKKNDIVDDEIKIMGKGSKERIVFLNPKAKLALENYLNSKSDASRASEYLFPADERKNSISLTHNTTSKSSIEKSIKAIGDRVKVYAHPHKFRRTFATLALERGMDLLYVSKILGHNNVDTTKVYLDISLGKLKEEHAKCVY